MASVARAVISFHTFHLHGAQRGLVQGHAPGGRQGACGTRAEVLVNGEKMNQLKLILLLMIPPDSSDSVFSGYSSALGSGTAQILLGPSTAIFCKNCRQKHHMTERFFFPPGRPGNESQCRFQIRTVEKHLSIQNKGHAQESSCKSAFFLDNKIF